MRITVLFVLGCLLLPFQEGEEPEVDPEPIPLSTIFRFPHDLRTVVQPHGGVLVQARYKVIFEDGETGELTPGDTLTEWQDVPSIHYTETGE